MRTAFTATLAAALAAALALGGCKKEEPTPPAPAAQKTEAQKAEVPKAAQAAADKAREKLLEAAKAGDGAGAGAELTLDDYEKLLIGLAGCGVDEHGIDRKCEAWKAFNDARRNRRNLIKTAGGGLAELGRKHIGHEAPAVRLQAATLMGSLFGASKESQDAIVAAARKEKDPGVLKAMIRTVSAGVAKNEEILKLVMESAAHENPKVRKEVISALTSTWARETAGTLEKAMQMVESDPADEVKRYGCSRLGSRGDERALPLLEKLTADSKTDPRLYADCMRGLIGMWASPIVHETPSQKAYELTLKRLRQKPRDENAPPWASLSSIMWAKNEKFQAKAPWFKKQEVLDLLAEIVKDRSAYWMARTAAVDALRELGVDKPTLEGLKKAYADAAGKPGQDKHVHDKIEKVLSGNSAAGLPMAPGLPLAPGALKTAPLKITPLKPTLPKAAPAPAAP